MQNYFNKLSNSDSIFINYENTMQEIREPTTNFVTLIRIYVRA